MEGKHSLKSYHSMMGASSECARFLCVQYVNFGHVQILGGFTVGNSMPTLAQLVVQLM